MLRSIENETHSLGYARLEELGLKSQQDLETALMPLMEELIKDESLAA